MQEFNIYSPTDKLVLSTWVDDDSYRLREIMGVNILELRFSLDHYVAIIEGSYCEFKAERYWMPLAMNYTKEHSEKYTYRLSFEGSINFLKSTKFKFFDYLNEGSTVKPTSPFKLKFPITATPRMVAELLVANLELKHPQYPWKVGDCIESEPVLLDFNSDFCFGVLPKLADAFSTEWELDKYTLNIGRVEKMKDSAIDLSYGFNKGIKSGVERLQLDSKRIINRVYVEGGDRNIDRSTYGNDTLLLPKAHLITYEGIEYTTDATGSYLERVAPLAGEEDSLDITKFYPKRVGEVSAVEKIDDKQGLYDIVDNSIPAKLDYSKNIIEGETMTVIFQTGQLAGKEFDVTYIHNDRRFELKPIDDHGLIYPQGNLIPEVGDKYAVFHMNMPKEYISTAEEEALQEVVKYFYENEQSQYSYRWALDGHYAKRNWGEIRGYLNCGFFVKFSHDDLPEPVDIRIVAVKELVNDDKQPEITVANNISSKTFGSIINEIPTQEQATDRKDQETVNYVKRGWKQAMETVQMLIDSGLEGFDAPLSPIALQTMMGVFGSETLQYYFVDEKDNPKRVPSGIAFDKESKRLVCPAGLIQHQTIGFEGNDLTHHTPDKYKYWETLGYQSDELVDGKIDYYLYLKCPKNDFTDGRYIISEKGIAIDELSNYYHFMVGVLNKENEEGDRSFGEMFGMTTIKPSGINTDRVVSHDGRFIVDLAMAYLEIFNELGKSMIKLDGSDGSGHLAGGNIMWDALSNILMRGRFESNKDGDRIVIDPATKEIQLISSSNKVLFSISFESNSVGGSGFLKVNTFSSVTGKKIYESKFNSTTVNIENFNTGARSYMDADGFGVRGQDGSYAFSVYTGKQYNSFLNIKMEGLYERDNATGIIDPSTVYVNNEGFLKLAKGS